MLIQDWISILLISLQDLWLRVMFFIPNLIGALIILIIGVVVAAGLGKLFERVVYQLKVDSLLRKLGLELFLNRANLELNSGHFFGRLIYWFILLAFVLAASDILGFTALSEFINSVLLYIPNVLIAALIMIATLFVANFVKALVRASVLSVRLHKGRFLGSLVWWVILIFGLLVSLTELGVAVRIIETVITGVIAMAALAGGLAFGLGGKEVANSILNKMRADWEHSHNG